MKAAHAARVARLEERRAVDLEKRLAGKEHVVAREFKALKRVATLEGARAIYTQAPGTVQRGGPLMNSGRVSLGPAGRTAARPGTKLKAGEPPPRAPVVTGLARPGTKLEVGEPPLVLGVEDAGLEVFRSWLMASLAAYRRHE